RVTGFGTVQPGQVWKYYPQVSGKIVWLSDYLDPGEFFMKGQKMLQIDDSVYKLKIIQQQAEIKKIEANLLELAAKKKNYTAMLELQKKNLTLTLREQERQRGLALRRIVSESTLEKQEIATLTQHNNVQNIQTELDLLPSQIKYARAQLEAAKAMLEQAKLDLEYTTVRAPFDCRIAKVNVEISQYVQPGQDMLEADCTSSAEIVAQADVGKLATLILDKEVNRNFSLSGDKYISIPERLGLTAVIKYCANGKAYSWKGECKRLEPIDPNTRTVGVAAVVDNPYRLGNRRQPPLIKGMYCEVDIYGKKQPDCIVIPRSAVHDNKVYKLTADMRLEIRKIDVKYHMSGVTVIKSGLKPGDIIVCSDLVPAIEGMLLETQEDTELEKRIEAIATGNAEALE
ncbi:MAG: efflux RND transporter periplasmic adaptor subunit, partial [Victivallales bacterium]|nr:efflux RND transporter periplasmic adaptor subunit [Victivallales bacterium]